MTAPPNREVTLYGPFFHPLPWKPALAAGARLPLSLVNADSFPRRSSESRFLLPLPPLQKRARFRSRVSAVHPRECKPIVRFWYIPRRHRSQPTPNQNSWYLQGLTFLLLVATPLRSHFLKVTPPPPHSRTLSCPLTGAFIKLWQTVPTQPRLFCCSRSGSPHFSVVGNGFFWVFVIFSTTCSRHRCPW